MAEEQYTNVQDWKSKKKASPLTLPSGNTCLLINPGVQAFLEGGIIPNSLMSIVLRAVNDGKGAPPMELAEVADNPEALADTMELVNRVVLRCVVQPPLHPSPAEGEPRDDEKLYVDELDLEDKFFVFQWVVGGTRDVEQFRKESTELVEDIQNVSASKQEA